MSNKKDDHETPLIDAQPVDQEGLANLKLGENIPGHYWQK
jgi:hypothetical protein